MTTKRKIAVFILVVGTLFLVFAIWYKYEYSMDMAQEFEVNSPDLNRKLLIATQGSEFKNKVTQGIVNYYQNDSLYIKVIDVTGLTDIDPKNYDAIVVIHTWENWQPPEDVDAFINRTRGIKDKIVVLTTSGEGSFKMENVDAITGESKVEDTSIYINQITKRLTSILKFKTMPL